MDVRAVSLIQARERPKAEGRGPLEGRNQRYLPWHPCLIVFHTATHARQHKWKPERSPQQNVHVQVHLQRTVPSSANKPAAFGLGPLSGLNQQSPRAYQPETHKLNPPRPRPPPLEVSSFYTFMAACSVSHPHALGTCWLVKGLKCHRMDTWTGYQAFSFSLELFHLDQVSLSTCEYTHHVIIHVLLRCHLTFQAQGPEWQGMIRGSCPACERSDWLKPWQRSRGKCENRFRATSTGTGTTLRA